MNFKKSRVFFQEPDIYGMTEAGYIGVDMHYHTDRSLDSLARINHVLRRAKNLGIGVAFTDHNEVSGAIDFFRNREKVMVIPGIELTCQEGVHTILYFYNLADYKEFAKELFAPLKHKNPFRLPIKTADMMDVARNYNCIVCAPHPFGPGATGLHKIRVTPKTEKLLDAVEAINAYNLRKLNEKAVKWASRIGKPVTGGSDGHIVAELGQALTFAKANDIESFLNEIKKGNSVVMGRENSLYEKAVVGIEKEESFFGRAEKKKEGMLLLKSQLGAEFEYVKKKIRERIRKEETFLSKHLFNHH